MKRLSTKIVPFLSLTLLLSAFFVFPVFADTSGSATATVQFNAIIDTFVQGAPSITVYQDRDSTAEGEVSLDSVDGEDSWWEFAPSGTYTDNDLSVTVRALTSYQVAAGYTDSGDETADDLLKLVNSGTDVAQLDHFSATWTDNADSTDHPAIGSLTELTNPTDSRFTGSPNLSSGGDEATYDLEIDMGKLTGDYADNDSLNLTVAFFVYDSTT